MPLLHSSGSLCSPQGWKRAGNSGENCYWMAVEERSGQTHHIAAWSLHSRHPQADVGEGEAEHPALLATGWGRRLWTTDSFLPTGLTTNPTPFTCSLPHVYRKKNNLIFAVAFQCNKQLSGDLNHISTRCKNVHAAFHQLNLIPTKCFDPAIYHFLGLSSSWISWDYMPEFAYPVGQQLHFRGRLVLWLQPSFYMPANTIYADQRL